MKRIAPLLAFATAETDPFRTYCDETQQVDISNFLPFGNGDWTSETSGNFIDLGDQLISEGDDLITVKYAGNSRHEFGNDRRYRLCISSNGPIYFERLSSACQAKEGDFLPLPFESSDPSNHWDGIAAVWADLVPFHESNRNGGNIYYRRVDKGNTTAQGVSDMAAASAILPPTDKIIENLHIITYHKMAESNSKRDCDIGASWQYVIAFYKDENNPSATINYGIQGWEMPNVIAGWNMNYLPQNSDLQFSDFVGQGTECFLNLKKNENKI